MEVCDFIVSILSGDFSRCCPGVRIGFPDHGENSPVLYGFVYGCPSSRQRFLSGDRNFPGIVGCHRYRLRNFPVIVRMFGDGPAVLEKSLPVVSGGP